MNKRLTPLQKSIYDRHIEAKLTDTFDDCQASNSDELRALLIEGKALRPIIEELETRYVTITSQLYSNVFGHVSEAYKKQIKQGFRILLNSLEIQ